MTRTLVDKVEAEEEQTAQRPGLQEAHRKGAESKGCDRTKAIRTHTREAVILPSWIGTRFEVHNGKEFQIVQVTANMLGHRLGEFAFTTKSVVHSAPGIKATRGSKFLGEKG